MEALNAKLEKTKYMTNNLKRIIVIKQELQLLEVRRDKLFEIIKGEYELNNLITQLDGLLSLNNRMSRVMSLQNNLLDAISERDKEQRVIDTIDVERLEAITQTMDKLISMLSNISNVQKAYERLKKEIVNKENCESIINNAQKVDDVIANLDRCREKLLSVNQISGIQLKIGEQKQRLHKGNEVIPAIEKQYNDKFQEYKDALIQNKQCPVCQSEITEEKVAGIKDLI
jgi:hypothetical protein